MDAHRRAKRPKAAPRVPKRCETAADGAQRRDLKRERRTKRAKRGLAPVLHGTLFTSQVPRQPSGPCFQPSFRMPSRVLAMAAMAAGRRRRERENSHACTCGLI